MGRWCNLGSSLVKGQVMAFFVGIAPLLLHACFISFSSATVSINSILPILFVGLESVSNARIKTGWEREVALTNTAQTTNNLSGWTDTKQNNGMTCWFLTNTGHNKMEQNHPKDREVLV